MIRIEVIRTHEEREQTLGYLRVLDGGREVFSCKTLELPWRDNEKDRSRIPDGIYNAKKHVSPKFGPCIWLDDDNLLPRTAILIHKGNFYGDTKGCILVGKEHTDIDGDGWRDVTSSTSTMQELLEAISAEEFTVAIQNYFLTKRSTSTYRFNTWSLSSYRKLWRRLKEILSGISLNTQVQSWEAVYYTSMSALG